MSLCFIRRSISKQVNPLPPTRGLFYKQQGCTKIGTWISNYIHVFPVTQDSSSMPNYNSTPKLPLNLEHGWVIISWMIHQIDGLVQNCSISIANALEILQSCTKPSKYDYLSMFKSQSICVSKRVTRGHITWELTIYLSVKRIFKIFDSQFS